MYEISNVPFFKLDNIEVNDENIFESVNIEDNLKKKSKKFPDFLSLIAFILIAISIISSFDSVSIPS